MNAATNDDQPNCAGYRKKTLPLDIVRLGVNTEISEYFKKKYRIMRNTMTFIIDYLVK